MRKIEVAVCDSDDVYRQRFVSYLVEHNSGEFAVYAFSTPESFLDQLDRQRPDVVIVGEGFTAAENAVKKRGIPLLLLQESRPEQDTEGRDILGDDEAGMPCAAVFRYQPVEAILHEVWVLTGGQKREEVSAGIALGGMETIGVYSPIRHEMQMPFSIVLSEILSETRKVLYVNLMEHSGFRELFDLPDGYDLGDIFIRLRNRRLSPEAFRRSVYRADGMSYIPPFGNPEDLRGITCADWGAFLDFLEIQTDFETAVLDLGMGMGNFTEVLGHCTSIYCPTKSGFFYDCQMRDFTDYLNQQTKRRLSERVHIIPLPFSGKQIRGGCDIRRQLLWSEFGDCVRGYVAGGAV